MSNNVFSERKRLRLKDFDYSSNNFYFVTVCIKNKEPLLSNIVGDDAHIVPRDAHIVPKGDLIAPKRIVLKPYGEIAEKHILRINTMYQNAYVEKYIIMPNHIHMLVFIDGYDNKTVNDSGTVRAPSPTDLSTVIRTFKTMVTKEIGTPIWQRSFYDEIIKNETHFQNVWNYIAYNALKEYSA